jgi:type II secretory pathway predicted ATPase ExeA/cell division septation protein DedD
VSKPDEINRPLVGKPLFRGRLAPQGGPGRQSEESTGVPGPTLQDAGSLTYESEFGLREKPFSLSSDPRFFFKNSANAQAFDALSSGIRRREGILALTGEVGTGKTTLCRAVLHALDRKTFATFVPDPSVSREELLKTLLVDFGAVSAEDLQAGQLRRAGRTDLVQRLCEFLRSLRLLQAFAVVIFEEAHQLPAVLLDEIRILSDLEDQEKLLQLVLVGQPELQSRLNTLEMRQVAQRVSVRCQLSPLARKDVGPYVSHRLLVAGNNVTVQFSDKAIETVGATSSGFPRLINLVCDRALQYAAQAGSMRVEVEHALGAARDLDLHVPGCLHADQTGAPWARTGQPELPARSSEAITSSAVAQGPGKARVAARATTPKTARVERRQVAAGPASLNLRNVQQVTVAGDDRDLIEDYAGPRPRRKRRFALFTPVLLALILGAGYWYLVAAGSPPLAQVMANPAILFYSRTPRVASLKPAHAAPAPGKIEPPQSEEPRAPRAEPARFVLEMGTFRTADQAALALQRFRDAGFHAYSVELTGRDRHPEFAVFLGPYSELAQVERDFDRASQIPGYGGARIVPIGPAELPPKPESQP